MFQRVDSKCWCTSKLFVHTSFKMSYVFLFAFCVFVCHCHVLVNLWALWFSSSALSTALTGGLLKHLKLIFLSHARKPQDAWPIYSQQRWCWVSISGAGEWCNENAREKPEESSNLPGNLPGNLPWNLAGTDWVHRCWIAQLDCQSDIVISSVVSVLEIWNMKCWSYANLLNLMISIHHLNTARHLKITPCPFYVITFVIINVRRETTAG